MSKVSDRANSKILGDAKEYLELVSQLGKIQRAVIQLPEDKLTPQRVDFIKAADEILDTAAPVADLTIKTVAKLRELPSSAPNHKRRAIAKELDTCLISTADTMHGIMSLIFQANDLIDD